MSATDCLPLERRVSSSVILFCLTAMSLERLEIAIFLLLIFAWATLIFAVKIATSRANEALSALVLFKVSVHCSISLLQASSSASSCERDLPLISLVQAVSAIAKFIALIGSAIA